MSQQPEMPSEGDKEFEEKVEQRMADKQDAEPDDDTYSNAPQEEQKTEVPVLEEDEESLANPGSTDA
ncbi:hypothetical protein [Kocuria aegyptia]|uniref:Multidrug transporter n=1 Tax=Kocuria aegyptia TaxID=330943 RepID=A0ABP4X7H3_9MICC